MAQLARERAGEIKKKKLPLTNDRFHVTPEQIKQQHVPEQMPRSIVQERRGEELPSISGPKSAIAQGKVFPNKSRLVGVKKELRDKESDVQPDQAEQDDPRPLRPAPGRRRRFLAGQAHIRAYPNENSLSTNSSL